MAEPMAPAKKYFDKEVGLDITNIKAITFQNCNPSETARFARQPTLNAENLALEYQRVKQLKK